MRKLFDMTEINPELVERYQILLEKEPTSKVFAPLAEAYRKMGLLPEAKQICEVGVKAHPYFAGGRVALSKILLEMKKWDEARVQLLKATELSPDNLLAHQLLAEIELKLKNPKESLKAFKMVLFLNPQHEKAQKAVQTLESLTADEYEDEIFEMKPLQSIDEPLPELQPMPSNQKRMRELKELERALSLFDAYWIRNDFDRAQVILEDAFLRLGKLPELEKRRDLLQSRVAEGEPMNPPPPRPEARDEKIAILQDLLKKIEKRTT